MTLVTDRARLPPGRGLAALAAEAAAAGLDAVQVREKDMGDRALIALLRAVATELLGSATRLIVNGRPDLATLAGAAGVQLPEEGLPPRAVRRAFPDLAIGASCHSVEGAVRAADEGAHWIVLGPVFATPEKEGRAIGLQAIAEAARRVSVPVHAVGGITAANARQAADAGARGVLAIRAFLDQPVAMAAAAMRGAR